jgi:serine/threonine protein kinase
MQWQPGHKLKNRPYEIEQVLGEGGFGITYKAKHLEFDISVVIKTPNSKLQRDSNYLEFVESFKREGKQLAQLGFNRHPHIVRVSDFFNEDNLPCIVMDFIEGKNLYDLVLTEGKLAEARAVKYIEQIASALATCHQAGIIHRDVSPLNIVISNHTKDAILIDFGISMSLQTTRNTHSGNRYFAPWEQMAYWEQQSSKTPQVDIYALAATFYFLVTGQVPIECLARKYNNEELTEPRRLNSSLSEAINNGILKGMELLPENRTQSIKQWVDLLIPNQQLSVKEQYNYKTALTHPRKNETRKKNIRKNIFSFNNETRKCFFGFSIPLLAAVVFNCIRMVYGEVFIYPTELYSTETYIDWAEFFGVTSLFFALNSGAFWFGFWFETRMPKFISLLIGIFYFLLGGFPGILYVLGIKTRKAELKAQRINRSKTKPTVYPNDFSVSNPVIKLQQELQKSTEYRTIRIRNFSFKVSKRDLKEVFLKYGTVEKVRLFKCNIFRHSDDDYALIQMKTVEEANTAIQTLDGTEWMGRTIEVTTAILFNNR